MSIPVPNLDDRNFTDLVTEAVERIRRLDPDWTDLTVHDPGVVLVEAFAHLTDILLYRLNRVPDRLYATFLNLLGTSLGPPGAATVTLEFSRDKAGPPVRIPRGTRVTCTPGSPGAPTPLFATLADVTIGDGQITARVSAADVELRDDVPVGTGTGGPGQSFTLPHAPLIAGPRVRVGVQVPQSAPLSGGAVVVGDRSFRIGREVAVFADAAPGDLVYRLDRTAGIVTFAWFAPGADPTPVVPAAGMAVIASYATGGGERGNVAAGRLTVLRDPLPGGIKVSNPEPATGGHAAEDLASALRRGPADFQARDRAVTARDYEVLATRNGGVARAHAGTRREAWAFAAPGEVEVVLVPHVPHNQRPGGRVTLEALAANAREEVRAEVTAHLAARATIGAVPVVTWGSYKQVAVDARVVVRPDENAEAVRERILARLAATITPAPDTDADTGAGFGRPLRVSNLYRSLEQAEPGVQYVERVRLELAEVPDADATDLVRAEGQDGTWFVAQNATWFRTTNHADGMGGLRALRRRAGARSGHLAPGHRRTRGGAQPARSRRGRDRPRRGLPDSGEHGSRHVLDDGGRPGFRRQRPGLAGSWRHAHAAGRGHEGALRDPVGSGSGPHPQPGGRPTAGPRFPRRGGLHRRPRTGGGGRCGRGRGRDLALLDRRRARLVPPGAAPGRGDSISERAVRRPAGLPVGSAGRS